VNNRIKSSVEMEFVWKRKEKIVQVVHVIVVCVSQIVRLDHIMVLFKMSCFDINGIYITLVNQKMEKMVSKDIS